MHFHRQGDDGDDDDEEEGLGHSSTAVDESLVAELAGNGINAQDARAALEHCNGDMILACEFVFQAIHRGGAAAVFQTIKEERIAQAKAAKMALSGRGGAASKAQRAQAEAEALLKRQRRSKMSAIKEEVAMIQRL